MLASGSWNSKIAVFCVGGATLSLVGYHLLRRTRLCTNKNSVSIFGIAARRKKNPKFCSEITQLLDHTYSIGNRKRYYNYVKEFANHTTHAAVALKFLGVATPNIVGFIHEINTEVLETPETFQKNNPSVDILTAYDCQWSDILSDQSKFRGKHFNFYGIRQMFERDLAQKFKGNIYDLLMEMLPHISNGCVGGALHGIIHVGYSVSVKNIEGILDGLTFLVFANVQLKKPGKQTEQKSENTKNTNKIEKMSFLNVIKRINADLPMFVDLFATHQKEDVDSIYKRIAVLNEFASERMGGYVPMMDVPHLRLPKHINDVKAWLMEGLIGLYVGNSHGNDFFLLHSMTASWATTEVLPYLTVENAESVLLDLLNAIIHVYVAVGAPKVEEKGGNGNGRLMTDEERERIKGEVSKLAHSEILPNYTAGKNVPLNNYGLKEHQYKVCQVLVDALENGIVDERVVYNGVKRATQSFVFGAGEYD